MRKLNRYGKTQGQIQRTMFLICLLTALVIDASGYGAYKLIKPKYEMHQERKVLEEQDEIARAELEEQERIAEQEAKMRAVMEGGTSWNSHTYKVLDDI